MSILNEILEHQLKSISASERMKELLELRLVLMNTGYATLDDNDKNELDIKRMKTECQIEKLKVVLSEKHDDFQESFSRYIEELEFEEKGIE